MTQIIDGLPDHLPQEVRDRILARRAQKAADSETRSAGKPKKKA